jgi:hypothetical protein
MNGSRTCECGREKSPTRNACERCQFLDGRTKGERLIIRALRDAGGYTTIYDIASLAGCSQRHVFRVMTRLIAQRRILRVEYNDIGGERTTKYCIDDRRAA